MLFTRRSFIATSLASIATALAPSALAQSIIDGALNLPFGFRLEGGEGGWPTRSGVSIMRGDQTLGTVAQAVTRITDAGQHQLALSEILIETDIDNGGALASSSGVIAAGDGIEYSVFQIKETLVGLRPGGDLAQRLGITQDLLTGPIGSCAPVNGRQVEGVWSIDCSSMNIQTRPLAAISPILREIFETLDLVELQASDLLASYPSRAEDTAPRNVSLALSLRAKNDAGDEVDLVSVRISAQLLALPEGWKLSGMQVQLDDLGLSGRLDSHGGNLIERARSEPALIHPAFVLAGMTGAAASTAADAVLGFINSGSGLVIELAPETAMDLSMLASYPTDLEGLRRMVKDLRLAIRAVQ
jgi:hypothetical protein